MNLEVLFNSVPKNANKYLDFYFYEMVKLKRNKHIFSSIIDNYNLSIMKDDPKRVLEGSGKLRARPWSNFVFYYMHIKDYETLFGVNSKRRKISADKITNGNLVLTQWDTSYSGKEPNNLFVNKENNRKIAKSLLDSVKISNPYLFIRAYVYLTIVLYDDSGKIDYDNFFPYYFNTTYNFTETNGKRGFIPNIKYSYLVEDIEFEVELITSNNRDAIDCAKAYIGNIEFLDQTKYNLDNIVKSIESGDKYILIEGAARTGKTIIAMSLLNKYPQSNLLLMNDYFYKALKDAFMSLNHEFPNDRIFHQSRSFEGYYDGRKRMNFSFSIIDECQRLGDRFRLVDRFINNKNHCHTILLGDNYQKLNPLSDDGLFYIVDEIVKTGESVKHFKFNNSIGIPFEVVKNIKYLLGFPEIHNPSYLGEYEIKIHETKDEFLDDYENNKLQKKHLCTIQVPTSDFRNFGKYEAYPRTLISNQFPYFLNKDAITKYYFSPYQMISREVDAIYIFVRKNIGIDDIRDYVLTNLYVLMTRAAISLNLYFEDIELESLFNQRLKEISEVKLSDSINIDKIPDNEQFIIKEAELEEFLETYNLNTPKDDIEGRFITGLVHFTNAKNIDNILKHGLMPRKMLIERNIDSVVNDNERLDGHIDSICLSVENPNDYLLKRFKEKYPLEKYKLITINPKTLYTIFIKQENRIALVRRIYCNYNAAAYSTLKSDDDMNIMFSHQVQTYRHIFTRGNKPESVPTAIQAEILFFGIIPSEFFDSIEDI